MNPDRAPVARLCIRHLDRPARVNTRLLRTITAAALAQLPSPGTPTGSPEGSEIGVYLADDHRMGLLHQQHLGVPDPTDVITLDYGPPLPSAGPAPHGMQIQSPKSEVRSPKSEEHSHLDPAPGLCGDLFIGLDVARRQAREFSTTWTAEVVRYVVHGLLHLRGFDDLEPAARRRMKQAENALVRRLAGRFDFARLAGEHRPRA